MPTFGPEGIVLGRIVGAALAFTAARRALGIRGVPLGDQGRVAFASFLGVVANQVLFMNGLARTSASHAALLTTTIPALTLGVSIVAGIERPTLRRLGGLVVAGSGAVLLITSRDSGPAASAGVLGDCLIVCNATVYSIYLVVSRPLLARHHALAVLESLFGWGALLVLPWVMLVSPELPQLAIAASPTAWGALAFLVLGPTIGAYGLNLYALRVVPPSTVALWIYVQPIVAAALAVPVLGERPTPVFLVSAALTFLGMWLGR